MSGSASCGAAVKADGYGLGANEVVARLEAVGCRDFFVATWDEAEKLSTGGSLSVLHGVRAEDMAVARSSSARPVLNSAAQILRWRDTRRPCDVMVDTGMNRLGISVAEATNGLLDDLIIDTLMSHLACAEQDDAMNERQRDALASLKGRTSARRLSLSNSAGICLGERYAFDLTRPGLALYGGVPRAEAQGHIAQVAFPEAQIIQRRVVPAGETIGYGAAFVAEHDTEVAILNIGYADGYMRGFSSRGSSGGRRFPVLGRVSMDLVAIEVGGQSDLCEGDWVTIDYALPEAARASGISQYELLTGLADRFDRNWC